MSICCISKISLYFSFVSTDSTSSVAEMCSSGGSHTAASPPVEVDCLDLELMGRQAMEKNNERKERE